MKRELISSASYALSKVFPKKSRKENREIVISALAALKREAKKGPDAFQKQIEFLETKVLGRTRQDSPPLDISSSSRPGDAPQELAPEPATS